MNYKFDDDETRPHRHAQRAKHSRNIPGKGMRIINSWYEEDDYDYEDDDFDDDVDVSDQVTIVHTKNSR